MTTTTITRHELNAFFSQLLSPEKFADYGPNGLQIEGDETISRIAFAVSATADSVYQAVSRDAQALIVHHGLFWKFHGPKTLTGAFAQRVFPLVRHQINLFAYHLPLDGHAEIGNAAVLGRYIGLTQQTAFGDYKGSPTGVQGRLDKPLTVSQLQQQLTTVLA
ncbi:MAG: Nif3-like dinuclear metal center hexameric protein, partial [Methylococcales bacterium]|nr:Nif3-like dinuclear metal center hexameric protein [Methylococcales bacterium]